MEIKKLSNLKLAAYLVSKGCTLVGVEPNQNKPHIKMFVLEGAGIQSLVDSFYQDRTIQEFISAQRILMDRIHQKI